MTSISPTTSDMSAALAHGFSISRVEFFQRFGGYRWLLGNLAADKQRDIFVTMSFLTKAIELLTETPQGNSPGPQWESFRDELRQAILDNAHDPLATAIVDVINRNKIARQWLFDVLDGVDLWTRFRRFESYEQLAHFACKIGGGAMNLLIPILEFTSPDYEVDAAAAGQAITLTQILLGLNFDLRHGRCLLPEDMAQQFSVAPTNIHSDADRRAFCRLIRTMACRIELEFFEAAGILNYLSFDGQRVVKSIFAWHWELLSKIKQDPLQLLSHSIALNRGEMAKLRLKHLLGTEGSGVPFVAAGLSQARPDHAH